MRLSEFINHPELQKRGIVIVGYLRTADSEFALLARKGEKIFPIPKLYQLVEVTASDHDPEVIVAEQRAILARFRYFDAMSSLPPK